MKPVEEMSLEELKTCLCNEADGKTESCLSCSSKCKFGARIEELHAKKRENFGTQEGRLLGGRRSAEKRAREGKIRYLQAVASGDPVSWYREHGYAKNTIYSSKHLYGAVTPEEAKRQLEEMGVDVESATSQNHPTLQSIVETINEYKRKENNNMSHSLLEEISIPEMQRMRDEEGLSNREIAARLGISYATVHKYLGPQPNDIKRRRFVIPQETTPPAPTIPTWNPSDWEAAETIHKLKGIYMHYEVNSTTNEADIVLIDGHPLGKLNKADLMKCIDELSRVAVLIK